MTEPLVSFENIRRAINSLKDQEPRPYDKGTLFAVQGIELNDTEIELMAVAFRIASNKMECYRSIGDEIMALIKYGHSDDTLPIQGALMGLETLREEIRDMENPEDLFYSLDIEDGVLMRIAQQLQQEKSLSVIDC